MRLGLSLAVLLLSSNAFASPVDVGGRSISIPTPVGFARVVPGMTQVSKLLGHSTTSNSIQLAAFIAEADVGQALANEIPALDRYYIVSVAKDLANRRVTSSQFAKLKEEIRGGISKVIDESKREILEEITKQSKNLSKELDEITEIKIGDIVPLPVHHEDQSSISFTQFVGKEVIDASGERYSMIGSVTVTFLHVRERVLFVNAVGGKEDLVWTRESSDKWINSIIGGNNVRSAVDKLMEEKQGSPAARKFMVKLTAYMIIGGVIAGISWLFNRSSKQ